MVADPLHERWIATVLTHASKLRDAGVLSIGVDGCSVTLAAKEPATQALGDIAKPDASVRLEEPRNPLEDPASYPFGIVPGFQIQQIDLEE